MDSSRNRLATSMVRSRHIRPVHPTQGPKGYNLRHKQPGQAIPLAKTEKWEDGRITGSGLSKAPLSHIGTGYSKSGKVRKK